MNELNFRFVQTWEQTCLSTTCSGVGISFEKQILIVKQLQIFLFDEELYVDTSKLPQILDIKPHYLIKEKKLKWLRFIENWSSCWGFCFTLELKELEKP